MGTDKPTVKYSRVLSSMMRVDKSEGEAVGFA
jgi:hypothetical protein